MSCAYTHFDMASSLSYSACWRTALSSAPFEHFTFRMNKQERRVMLCHGGLIQKASFEVKHQE